MYIKSFHIEGFGPLKDFSVNDIPCGMAVFLGNNEAGKSSAMEFVRAMLMGIPTKRNSLTQNIRNSKGGSMKIHDTNHGEINLVRHFSNNASLVQLYDAHGNMCQDAILTEIMGGVSRDVYRMIYGFNLVELQNINNFHGSEVFNTILGASFGLGLRGPVAALENIQSKMDVIHKTRGKNTILQKLFDAWNNNKSELDTAFAEVKQFDVLQEERLILDSSLTELRDKKSLIIDKGEELQTLISMWGQWRKWFELQSVIATLPPVTVSFPENAELVLERILEQEKIKQKTLESLNSKYTELGKQKEEHQTNSLLLEQHTALKDLMEEKGSYRQALGEITPLTVKSKQFFHILEETNTRLKDKWQLLDGKNPERHAFNPEVMAQALAKIPHDELFLEEFSAYEAKILDAESHAQSTITALEYAQRDLNLAQEKKFKIEADIRSISEQKSNEQGNDSSSTQEQYAEILGHANLAKEAIRFLPEKAQRVQSTFGEWKKQIAHLTIDDLDTHPIEEEDYKDTSLSIAISDENERNYYIHASNVIEAMQSQREKILPIAQQYLEEEDSSRVFAEKIERITGYEQELNATAQISNPVNTYDAPAQNIADLTAEKEELEVQSRVIQKLQTIDGLRAQSMQRLEDLGTKQDALKKSIADKTISKIALVPGILCAILGLPLLILRIMNGQDAIALDKLQSIISFAELFPSWSGTLYVPFWLPLVLTLLAIISIYLPISRRSDADDEYEELRELDEHIAAQRENLAAIRKEEIFVIMHTFGISEAEQAKYYEKTKAKLGYDSDSIEENQETHARDQLVLFDDEPIATTDSNQKEKEEDSTPQEDALPTHNLSLSLDNSDDDKNDENDENDYDENDKNEEDIHNLLEPDSLPTELFSGKNLTAIPAILKNNHIYRELTQTLQDICTEIREKKYAHFIASEQEHDASEQSNDADMKTNEKRAELSKEKAHYQELFNENTELLANYKEEWESFFKEYFFTQAPDPRYMEAFFLRIDACANIQKQFIELNSERQCYDEHIQKLHEIAQSDFVEVYEKTQANLEDNDINISTLIENIEKHIQELHLSALRNNDTSAQDVALETAIQAENQMKTHLDSVTENLHERQALVNNSYDECITFLCNKGILASPDAQAHYAKMNDEKTNASTQSPSTKQDIGINASIKKLNIPLFKQVLEFMDRFDASMLEYEKIKFDMIGTEDIIADFESFLMDLVEEAKFTPILENNAINHLETFERFHARIEHEITKNANKENIGQQSLQVAKEIESVQADIDEIHSNMQALLDLAKVKNESQLRELIEAEKQRGQIIRSSLALEEPFHSVDLPKFVAKSSSPGKRQYPSDLLKGVEELPDIFDYFSKTTKEMWQEELITTKKSYEVLDANEHEVQNNYGALQAKCDALIQSASLASLRRKQLDIEEQVEEAYESWLELSFTKQVITKARKQYELERQPKVIALASEFFATITDNAWEKIIVSMDDKDIKVVGKNGSPVTPDVLSQGTKEQLYLALRLAHVQSRTETHQPIPILMDDILVNFDKKRMENTIDTLNKLITARQEPLIGAANQESMKEEETSIQTTTDRILRNNTIGKTENEDHGQQILFYTCHEDTAQILRDKIKNTQVYLVDNKTVRPA